jgi:hypothetical protein
MTMNELFRAAGRAVSTVVEIGVLVYAAKYGFDAYHGDYCFPAHQSGVMRPVSALGNDVVNLVTPLAGKASCPRTPIFVAPSTKAHQELNR